MDCKLFKLCKNGHCRCRTGSSLRSRHPKLSHTKRGSITWQSNGRSLCNELSRVWRAVLAPSWSSYHPLSPRLRRHGLTWSSSLTLYQHPSRWLSSFGIEAGFVRSGRINHVCGISQEDGDVHCLFLQDCYALFRSHNLAIVDNVSPDDSTLRCLERTASFTYTRMHKRLLPEGPDNTNYTDAMLAPHVAHAAQQRTSHTQYIFFMNDLDAFGPHNALAMMALVQAQSTSMLVAGWIPKATGSKSIKAMFAQKQQPRRTAPVAKSPKRPSKAVKPDKLSPSKKAKPATAVPATTGQRSIAHFFQPKS